MWRIAWRNLWRQPVRSLIIVSAIALGSGLMLFSFGMSDYMHGRMMQSAIDSAGGSVLIHGDGFWDSQSTERVVRDPASVMERAREVEGVEAVIPRVIVNGMLRTSRHSGGVRLTGIDPEAEAEMRDWAPYVIDGAWVGEPSDVKLRRAAPLVLGSGLVEDMRLEIGDTVSIAASAPNGEVVWAPFKIVGVLETGVDGLDSAMAYTTLEGAQRSFEMGDAVTQIGILVGDDEARGDVRDALATALDDRIGSDDPDAALELLTWDEAIPEMIGFVQMDDAWGYVVMLVIFLVVAFGIANTFLMSVMERTRELGLLSALGLTPAQIAVTILYEALLLAAVSLSVGLAIALIGHASMVTWGLDMTSFTAGDMEVSGVLMTDMVIHSELRVGKWAATLGLVFVLVVLSSLYPAFRATRLNPVEAMRTYE